MSIPRVPHKVAHGICHYQYPCGEHVVRTFLVVHNIVAGLLQVTWCEGSVERCDVSVMKVRAYHLCDGGEAWRNEGAHHGLLVRLLSQTSCEFTLPSHHPFWTLEAYLCRPRPPAHTCKVSL